MFYLHHGLADLVGIDEHNYIKQKNMEFSYKVMA